MNLYIDTSGKYCIVALMKDSQVLEQIVHQEAMQHSTVLHSLINDLLEKQQVTFKDINAVGLMNGPGSYTGLRIGLAAAKGFCYALDLPLVLFNKLDISCTYYQDTQSPAKDFLACIEPARSGEFFFYMKKGTNDICVPSVYDTEDILAMLKKYPNHNIISSENKGNEEITDNISVIDIPMTYISQYLSKQLFINNLSNIYTSEPFYLKKVHANTPKKRF